jgi:hypothetical protein
VGGTGLLLQGPDGLSGALGRLGVALQSSPGLCKRRPASLTQLVLLPLPCLAQEPDKQCLHLCIINLVIGTLYCSKGNYEFGISRVIKSLEPYDKKLEADTWWVMMMAAWPVLEACIVTRPGARPPAAGRRFCPQGGVPQRPCWRMLVCTALTER